jgi:GntR family transcriptional repressor for pyruvate dehydrogenase complex
MEEKKGGLKNGFNPIKNKRLFEVVADQIRGEILSGPYKSGDYLASEKELCQSFSVGRPVIREALRMLENSGILSIRPGSGGGIFVKRVGAEQMFNSLEAIIQFDKITVQQITEARLLIEKGALRLAMERLQAEDLERLEENVALAKEYVSTEGASPKSLEFHIILSEATRNPLLIVITRALFSYVEKHLLQVGPSVERKKQFLAMHELILAHIKNNDAEQAIAVLEKDINELSAVLREA